MRFPLCDAQSSRARRADNRADGHTFASETHLAARRTRNAQGLSAQRITGHRQRNALHDRLRADMTEYFILEMNYYRI
jgi:hypothetical protein